ncbi:MAG: hypothetical protein HY077_08250 [Elusimicrobia bacterium]|nr:hypothetical protein [Elusimicrobiota bacterium]
MQDKELVEALCGLLASGRLDNGFILPVLKEIGKGSGAKPSTAELIEILSRHPGSSFEGLVAHLKSRRRLEASRCHNRKATGSTELEEFRELLGDLPLDVTVDWLALPARLLRLQFALTLQRDRFFLETWGKKTPKTEQVVDDKLRKALAAGAGLIDPLPLIERLESDPQAAALQTHWEPLKKKVQELNARRIAQARASLSGAAQPFPQDLDEEAAAHVIEGAQDKCRALDAAASWPTSRLAPVIRKLGADASLQERAALIMELRFGSTPGPDWPEVSAWLARVEEQDQGAAKDLELLCGTRPAELLLLWTRRHIEVPDDIRRSLESWCRERAQKVPEREFLQRHGLALSNEERLSLAQAEPKAAPVIEAPFPKPAPETPVPPAAPEEVVPSFWTEHLLPFFAENWGLLAGIAMVVVGSSLLAFYTWDKHWFVRYTVLPALLAGLTALLARMGSWLERQSGKLKGTADMLRGAAIALLPANFMAVALMAHDPQVTHKDWVLPLVALAYVAGFGRGLRRWCAAVNPDLKDLLGLPLLLINALVLLGPFALVFDPDGDRVWFILGAGFHAGFLLVCIAILRFVRTELSPALIEEGRVPWFFGVSLTTTFLQVFLWVYGFMRHLPQIQVYAAMVVAAGGLVLFGEQCSRSFRKESPAYGKDSFIGYALILLGLFMGASQPQVRLLTLVLAGAIWTAQALFRRDILHAWIAFTLLALGGGSIGTWESFPGPRIPALGLGLALAVGGSGIVLRRWWEDLAKVASQMTAAVLNVTTVLAVLVQWHYNTPPLHTAVYLLLAAALFGWRAYRDQNLVYVHTVMAILGVSLPYLGFADMSGRTLHGNNMVFGLSLLSLAWLAAAGASRSPLLRNARSTVLLVYGAVAIAAMCLRVFFEQGLPENAAGIQVAMTMGAPLLMSGVLVTAAYFSRSLLPAGMAALIVFILLPELKAESEALFPFIEWGSGLMSGVCAAALALGCFSLRAAPFLAGLGEGDLFMGKVPFPLQRRDHSLFTNPLMASALFLAFKVDTWNLARNLLGAGIHLRGAAGLVVAGLAWTLIAVYFRTDPRAKIPVHLGWISATAGIVSGYYDQAADPRWHGAALLVGLVLNALYFLYRDGLRRGAPWVDALLAAPLRSVLRAGSLLVCAALLWALSSGDEVAPLKPLLTYASAQLCWFALADEKPFLGGLLFLQTWAAILAWSVPGGAPLLERLTPANSAAPTLLFFLWIQACHLLMEPIPEVRKRLSALAAPSLMLASLATLAAGLWGLYDGVFPRELSSHQQLLLLAAVLAAARAQACGPLVLLGAALAYVDVFTGALGVLAGGEARFDFLLSPWRLAAFSLTLAMAAAAGSELRRRWSWLTEGRYAQEFFRLPAAPWLQVPALLLAGYAVISHAADPALRNAGVQLWTPYLAAAAYAVVGLSLRRQVLFAAASLCLADGNIHLVRFYLGDALRARGLMENHLLCLGATATLFEFSAGRLLSKREDIQAFINRVCLVLAGSVLAMLTSTYFLQPDLELMTSTRFIVSGLMAYVAGRYFQRASRRPDAGEAANCALWEGLYHYGVTTAIWCAAMLVPWFRHPNAAFPALGLPVLYFYLRAELSPVEDRTMVARYRNTAAALCFFMLVLYAFRGAFQMVLFPQAPLGLDHYHFNAPFVMALALLMMRLHGLGGTSWLALYGGLAMIVGSFFSLTRLPGLSPFDFPMPSAWCSIGMGHFWILFCSRPSPLKTFLQRMGAIDDELWRSLQNTWGLVLLAATQTSLLWGLTEYSAHTFQVAPLLLGGASLLIHQGLIRREPAFFVWAGVELMAALHADFFVASYLHRAEVIWAVLGLWGGFLVLAQVRPQRLGPKAMGPVAFTLGAAAMLHVLYHHPDSTKGLWAFGLGAALAALTPRAARAPASSSEALFSGLLLAVPTWLVYFSQCREPYPWPVLAVAGSVFLTGAACRWVQDRYAAVFAGREPQPPRLFDQTLSMLGQDGWSLNTAALYSAFALAASVQILRYDKAFDPRSLGLILGLYGASVWGWWEEGVRHKTMPPYFMIQFCALGFFAVVRRQLMLTLHWWNYEYDVWASLLVSYSLAGAKQVLPLSDREVRIPLLGTLLTMPVAAMLWVLLHHLGTNTVLLVVGLYSIMFSYMGKDDQESPYHIVAVAGFVSFIMIVFWTKLELRVLQAYVIPVGLGILVLLQLFRNKIQPALRNEIRAVTLLAMLGSAAYYALTDERYPMAFHMTLLMLGVLSMSLGSFLKVRLYVLLGLAGVGTDLASILYKVLMHMDRSSRMTLIGTQVLILGALLIGGAVVYKTHQEKLNETLDLWRQRLTSWE